LNAAGERVAVVTGASAGIGLYTALGLAQQGMRVVLVGRDPARTERARRLVAERSGSGTLDTAIADLASIAAVRRLADGLLADYDGIDLLVNNAGLISPHFQLSEDGYELTVSVNHLAPFLLTNLLLDRLRTSAQTNQRIARILTVASQAHRGARLNIAALTRPRDWTPLSAYGRSKLCNVLFTRALARRLDPTQVTAACLHPGVVATAIGDRAGAIAGFGWRLIKPFLFSPERGAATSLFLAAVPDPTPFHGAYVVGKRIVEPDAAARDDRRAEELWAESARLVGLPASAAAGA
jgi:NAD(P)-dependent dehydrogenase (short-subunit alcohol dehydrogenase family)